MSVLDQPVVAMQGRPLQRHFLVKLPPVHASALLCLRGVAAVSPIQYEQSRLPAVAVEDTDAELRSRSEPQIDLPFMQLGMGLLSDGSRGRLVPGRWHHVALVARLDEGALQCFVDGTPGTDIRGAPELIPDGPSAFSFSPPSTGVA